MNAVHPLMEVVAAGLMLLGALSCLLGAIGLVRLPDLPARLQAATKPQTLGLSLVLLGTALRVELASAVTLVLVVVFQVLTAPVVAQLVGRAAYRSGGVPEGALVVDELAAHVPGEVDGRGRSELSDADDPAVPGEAVSRGSRSMGFATQMVPGQAEVGSRTGRTRAGRHRSQGPSGREERDR